MFVAPDCPDTMPGFPFAWAALAVCLALNSVLSELPLTDATPLLVRGSKVGVK